MNNYNKWLMKLASGTLAVGALALVLTACSELEDKDHYADTNSTINNNELSIVNVSSQEYMKNRADLSKMNKLFADHGIYEELNVKGQLSTMLVVTDDLYKDPTGTDDEQDFITRSHLSDVSISPANLHNGDRIMMWHGKYVNITIDSLGQSGQIVDHILFNNAAVKEVVQTNNGYIYVISDMINTPTSLSDFINSLDDNYSIFKEMVLSSGGKEFDRANSKAIGINDEGNTLYDTVWIYTNEHFDNVGFDMNSESLTATMLLFSNDVINKAMEDAHQRLEKWGLERSDSILKQWILDVAFFTNRYTGDELSNNEPNDLKSVFGKQWRTNVQEVDKANPIELSNGIVYEVKSLHLPNNLLMYRLKDWFYYYENCTDEQKAEYFKMTNMAFSKCNTDVTSWSPLPGVWPNIEDRVLILKTGDDGAQGSLQLDFTPIRLKNEDRTNKVEVFNIPPGAYRLAMGFKQNQNMTIRVKVFVEGVPDAIAASNDIFLSSATTYHYDRGATLPDRYPEGYDPAVVTAMGGSSKASNYDTDGGPIIDEVVIPDVKGDNSASRIVIRIEADNWNDQTSMTLNHWCLRPTVNNY
ncbi:MAG: hypothetical protein ACI4BA_01760 [Prevotella sp.]